MIRTSQVFRSVTIGLLVALLMGSVALPAEAQRRPDRRKTRTDISPELLVSFEKDTPLNQFIELINPIVERELDKSVVDPQNRSTPIGVPVSGMHYLDALNKVLEANNLTYQETETVFLVKEPTQATKGAAPVDTAKKPPATVGTREIRISAVLFNLNLTEVRNRGLRWDEILGSTQGGQGGGGGGQGGEGAEALAGVDREGKARGSSSQLRPIICSRASTTSCRRPSRSLFPGFVASSISLNRTT